MTSRTNFIKTALAAASMAWTPRLSFAPVDSGPRGDTLVVVFLRGAADVLNLAPPFGEEAYYKLRPTLGIAPPDQNSRDTDQRAVNLDGFFGLHPAMRPLLPIYQAGELALVHACGAPDESRSHFKAMELMERGVEQESGPASGWISRHLAAYDTGNRSPLRAVGFGAQPQRSLRGAAPVTALRSISDFHYDRSSPAAAKMSAALAQLYSGGDALGVIGQETLSILDMLSALDPENYQPNGEAYPEEEFAQGLKQIAMLVKAESGLEVAAIDLGGWDTHFAQGGSVGLMANLARQLAGGLAAFYNDLQDYAGRLTVVVMTEFGRRARENGSLGTDHGHGAMMMVMGGNVAGGRVHGRWPGLEAHQLVSPGDLAVTTDYRHILAEICAKRLNNPALEQIFPNFRAEFQGIVN